MVSCPEVFPFVTTVALVDVGQESVFVRSPSPALKFAGAALDSWQDPRSRLTAYLMV